MARSSSVSRPETAKRSYRLPAALAAMGFRLLCTGGTAQTMKEHGISVEVVRKIHEGRPNVLDYLANGTIDLIVNTPERQGGTDR